MESQIIEAYQIKFRRYKGDMNPQVLLKAVEPQSGMYTKNYPALNPLYPNKTQAVNQFPNETSAAVKLDIPDSDVQVPDSENLEKTGKTGIFKTIKRFFSGILSK